MAQVQVGSEKADVQFYKPGEEDRMRRKPETKQMWRGDHKMCRHSAGVCVSPRGWILDATEWKFLHHVVPVSIEERAMGTVSYPGQKGRYPESTQTAKGMVDWSPELESVRPTAEVIGHLTGRYLKAYTGTLKRDGYKGSELADMVKARRQEIERANSPRSEKKGKADG